MKLIALLRAINVGGHVVKMDRLRAIIEAEGFSGVETFIASGNLIFDGRFAQARRAEGAIERALLRELGYTVVTFVRSDAELAAIAHDPFPAGDIARAATFCVGFLKDALDQRATARLTALRTSTDDLHGHGREVYWLSRLKQSESTFSAAVLERVLGVSTTFRGIATVRKLSAKYPARRFRAGGAEPVT